MPSRDRMLPDNLDLTCLGPRTMTLILSEFNKRKLEVIQSFTSLRHAWSLASGSVSSGCIDKYSCVSFKYVIEVINRESRREVKRSCPITILVTLGLFIGVKKRILYF